MRAGRRWFAATVALGSIGLLSMLHQTTSKVAAAAAAPIRVYMTFDSSWTWGAIIDAGLRQAPSWVHFVGARELADVEVKHIVGKKEADEAMYRPENWPPTVVVQHVIETSSGNFGREGPRDCFRRLWRRSLLTVSFHDLALEAASGGFAFLPLPWGADGTVFLPPPADRHTALPLPPPRTGVLIAGAAAHDESLGEVLFAAAHAGVRVAHIGTEHDPLCGDCARAVTLLCSRPAALRGSRPCDFHDFYGYVSTARKVAMLQRVEWVSALRKTEGFELLAVEGMLCGARPIVYNLSTYRWYAEHAVRVPPPPGSEAFEALVNVLRRPAPVMTPAELSEVRGRFDWRTISAALFTRVRSELVAADGHAARPGRWGAVAGRDLLVSF